MSELALGQDQQRPTPKIWIPVMVLAGVIALGMLMAGRMSSGLGEVKVVPCASCTSGGCKCPPLMGSARCGCPR